MKKIIIFAAIFALLCPINSFAQRRYKKKKKKPVPEVVEDPKFTAMLDYTAKVTVIDSIVVDSTEFLNAIYPNYEEGRITRYDRFFSGEGDGIVYINQLGENCIYSKKNQGSTYKNLYESSLLFDGWTPGDPLKGIDDGGLLYDFDYPYLMPDGITLYFAARSAEGLGGYDIYRTRLDMEGSRFLRPENMGLPFNSDKDDFMFVIDEQNQLGYFVSNRNQPAGKTCVYTFIPFETRKTISEEDGEKKRSLARLDRIADTWGDGKQRMAALERKQRVIEILQERNNYVYSSKFNFIINDQTTYHKVSDFRPENRERIKTVINLQKQEVLLQGTLEKARNFYSKASSLERKQLSIEILSNEEQLETLRENIRDLEKIIRNTENQ